MDDEIPKFLILFMTGASLSVAGAIMQAIFANPLASPTLFGISGGGSLATILALYFGGHLISSMVIPLFGFLGCFLALACIYLLAKAFKLYTTQSLLLIGIAFSTLIFALQGAFLYALRYDWEFIQLISEWQAATTTFLNWEHAHLQFPLTLVGLLGALAYTEELNIISLGDEEALHLGLKLSQMRLTFFILVALLLAGSLASLGEIPFLGLIVPHIVRLITGANYKTIIPYSALVGGLVLILLAELSTEYLSVTHLTGILGGFALMLILIKREKYAYD